MKGLLIVTMLMMAVMVVLPPAGTGVALSGRSQAADSGILTSVAMLFTGLRDLMYGIGETAIKASNGLWEALPERLKPLVGLMVLVVSTLALVGSLTLSSLAGVLRRFTGQ
jgi:hypothetical protein